LEKKETSSFFSFEDLEGNFFITTLTGTPNVDLKIQSFWILHYPLSHPLIFSETFSVLLLKDHAVQPAMCQCVGWFMGAKWGK
jgi:hypothetical protein